MVRDEIELAAGHAEGRMIVNFHAAKASLIVCPERDFLKAPSQTRRRGFVIRRLGKSVVIDACSIPPERPSAVARTLAPSLGTTA
jgi:hypothetical protein